MYQSVVEVFRGHVERRGERVAYRFSNGQQIVCSFSFGEIDHAAKAVASRLQEHCEVGDRALLLTETEADFVRAFFGCLYAGVVAVPLNLPVGDRGVAKIRDIVANASARVLLGSESALQMLAEHDLSVEGLEISSLLERPEPGFVPVNLRPEHVAFLQYTSGSTGAPKGVVVTHGNLLANEEMIRRSCKHDEDSLFVGWLPLFHDMGLVGNILQPAYVGIPSILMPPAAFIRRPRRWLQLISDHQATTSGGPNFAYDICVRRIDDSELDGLDLRSWRIAFNGAEPIRSRTLELFASKFRRAGFSHKAFYPVYGLAEATLMVTANDCGVAPHVRHVSAQALQEGLVPQEDVTQAHAGETRAILACGRPRPGQVVRIVHPERYDTLGEREVGEIWVAGTNVAKGYWNNPELTAATFQGRTCEGAGPFLRTGDLGFMDDGLLYITGRSKDVLVINGRNHYPQDLEHTVTDCDPAFAGRPAAAVVVADGESESVVVLQEVSRLLLSRRVAEKQRGRLRELVESIGRALSVEHGLFVKHILLVPQGALPLTTSGKIQRARCRELLESGQFAEFSAPALARAAMASGS